MFRVMEENGMPRSALLLGSLVVGAALLAPPGATGGLGLADAQAAPAKKAKARSAKGKAVVKRETNRIRIKFAGRKSFAVKVGYATLPKFKPKVVLRAAPVAASAAVAPTSPEATAAVSDLTAKTAPTLPPERVIATASIGPMAPVHPGAEHLRPALEARARSMASELGLATLPLPEAAPTAQFSARSVTFDLEHGTRTVVFEDGTSVTAPFDRDRAAGMTGVKAASR